jgi:hypothetical protein
LGEEIQEEIPGKIPGETGFLGGVYRWRVGKIGEHEGVMVGEAVSNGEGRKVEGLMHRL